MYQREVPKLNIENFPSWKIRMWMYLSRIEYYALYYLDNQYTSPPLAPMIVEWMREKEEHTTLMIEISSSLIDTEFDDVKDFST